MFRMRSVLPVGFLLATAWAACGDKNAPTWSPGTGGASGFDAMAGSGGGTGGTGGTGPSAPSYATEILPLLLKECACHVSYGTEPLLDTYDNLKLSAEASDKSIQDGTMPTSAPLSDGDKALFHAWVVAGAPNN